MVDYSFTNGNLVPLNGSFYVKAIISPFNKIASIFHKYLNPGIYLINASLTNTFLNTYSQSITCSVKILETIKDLSFYTQSGTFTCYKNVNCILVSSTSYTGTDLNFIWSIEATNIPNGNMPSVSYTFNSVGLFKVQITAFNTISNRTFIANVQVTDKLTGLAFKSGESEKSASIVGTEANFLFSLQSGANYICNIDFGNGIKSFSDQVYNLNNTFIKNTFYEEKMFTIYIECSNQVNKISLTFEHYVQYSLSGLKLVENGTLLNRPYSIDFSLQTGSSPLNIEFYLNNKLEIITYSGFIGKSSIYPAESTTKLHQVYIKLKNYVSLIELNTTFEISTPILNPTFTILPSIGLSEYTYSYPTELTFKIDMSQGSNVKIKINTDLYEIQALNEDNLIQISTQGDWSQNTNSHLIKYNYPSPGDFNLQVTLWNSLSSFTFSRFIKIISKVSSLKVGLKSEKSFVLSDYGLAEFVFYYLDSSKAGSHSSVTFWPGDSTLQYGAYSLSIDFNRNMSRTQLSYIYKSPGGYDAKFEVINPRETAIFNFRVNVVLGIVGFYINVSPKYAKPNETVLVDVYLIQGFNVSLDFFVNQVLIDNAFLPSNYLF